MVLALIPSNARNVAGDPAWERVVTIPGTPREAQAVQSEPATSQLLRARVTFVSAVAMLLEMVLQASQSLAAAVAAAEQAQRATATAPTNASTHQELPPPKTPFCLCTRCWHHSSSAPLSTAAPVVAVLALQL